MVYKLKNKSRGKGINTEIKPNRQLCGELNKSIIREFRKIVKDLGHKRNKIWVDKGGEFYNKSMKNDLLEC